MTKCTARPAGCVGVLTTKKGRNVNPCRQLRKRLNLTQEQFAPKLGITTRQLSTWENDNDALRASPVASTLIRVCLECPDAANLL